MDINSLDRFLTAQEFFSEEKERDELSIALSKLSPKQKRLLIAFLESL